MVSRYFRNVSNRLYFLGELNKRIDGDPDQILVFSEDDIKRCRLLSTLVGSDAFEEIKVNEEGKLSGNAFGREKSKPIKRNPLPDSVAEPIGGPDDQIAINTSSRLLDIGVQEAPSLSKAEGEVGSQFKVSDPLNSEEGIFSFGDISDKVDRTANSARLRETDQLEIWFNAPANDASGYGKFSRYCIEGLHNRGVKVQLELFKIPDFRCSVPMTDVLQETLKTEVSDFAPSVWAIMPPNYLHRKGRKILFTMMETNGVPKRFAEKCNNADELWLPSLSNVDVFEKANLKPEIFHMPLGVDTTLYRPMNLMESQRNKFDVKTKDFVFLSLFGWSLRKGVDVLFRSYLEEFSDQDNVTLLVVSRKDGSSSPEKIGEIHRQIKEYISRWSQSEKPPHIVHIGQSVPEEDLPILYNMSNCFALCSRGEGFCLPMAEAGACGIPVIGTRCGGQMDFLTDENSYLIDIEGYAEGNQEIKSLSSYYEKETFAVLGENAVSQTKQFMRHVLNNADEANKKAGKLKENLESNFTWDLLVDKIYNRLEEIRKMENGGEIVDFSGQEKT